MSTPPPPHPPLPPGMPQRLPELLAQRDSSLPLAAAALARIADHQGHTTFGDLAVAYREEFLQLRAHTRGASLPELGGLSLEDFRTSLRTSVLPRLAVMKVVLYPVGPLFDDAPVAFTREAWAELQPELQMRSEEHTSELQSPCNLVCRLLLEKKKKQTLNVVTIH